MTDVLGSCSLEFATSDHRIDAHVKVVDLPGVRAVSIALGGDVTCVHDEVEDYVVHVPMAGSLLVRGSRHEFWATSQRPSVFTPPGPITTGWAKDTTAIVFRLDRASVEAELASLMNVVCAEAFRFQSTMDATVEPQRSWRATAIFVASTLDSVDGLLGDPRVAPYIERVLIRGLLLAQPHTYSAHLANAASQSRPHHVSEAIRLMRDRPDQPFTTGSLARAVGATARALQDGFRQHVGVSPMRYLRTLRLRGARADLLALGGDDPATVADVGARWGFPDLVRFVQYYRSEYGEPPSQTPRAP